MTAAVVAAMLEKTYGPPAYAFMREVGNSTGFGCNRHADALALSLWPSRGIYLIGFEIKVSRGDWLRELSDPHKSESIQQYCSKWFVAAGSESIVEPAELPETWGLLAVSGKRLKTIKQAPPLEPRPLDKKFVAAVLRKAAEAQAMALKQEYERGKADGTAAAFDPDRCNQATTRELEALKCQYNSLRSSVSNFHDASGVQIDNWNGGDVGEIVGLMNRLNMRFRSAEVAIREIEFGAQHLIDRVKTWREIVSEIERKPAIPEVPK